MRSASSLSQALSCVLNHKADNSPQGHVNSNCFPFFYVGQTLSVLFFFSQLDISSSLTNSFSYLLGLL